MCAVSFTSEEELKEETRHVFRTRRRKQLVRVGLRAKPHNFMTDVGMTAESEV